MRLFLDQMFHLDLAVLLRAEGHDVLHVAELGRSRADDEEVLQLASSDERVLVTRDGNFGDWTVLPLHEHAGVIPVETASVQIPGESSLFVPAHHGLDRVPTRALALKFPVDKPDRKPPSLPETGYLEEASDNDAAELSGTAAGGAPAFLKKGLAQERKRQ